MEESDERYGEANVLPLSLHPIDDLPKEIKMKIREGIVVVGHGDGMSAWAKARI